MPGKGHLSLCHSCSPECHCHPPGAQEEHTEHPTNNHIWGGKFISPAAGLNETVLVLGAGLGSLPGTLLFQQTPLRCSILM